MRVWGVLPALPETPNEEVKAGVVAGNGKNKQPSSLISSLSHNEDDHQRCACVFEDGRRVLQQITCMINVILANQIHDIA